MITAGDEFGRSQRGNNNAYCQDSELTWLNWDFDDWQQDLHRVTRRLLQLRRENPALRPVRFGRPGKTTPSASRMHWFNQGGESMSEEDWNSSRERTLQYLAASTPEHEDYNRILLIVHGLEHDAVVTLPTHEDVTSYTLLWDSSHDDLRDAVITHEPGTPLHVTGASIQLLRTNQAPR
jgi:glycogen operon protein